MIGLAERKGAGALQVTPRAFRELNRALGEEPHSLESRAPPKFYPK